MESDFEQHVNANYQNLYYFALSLAKNEADAADFTQQAYLKLAKNWNKIADKSKIKSWLFSTLYREFVDRRRRGKFQANVNFEVISETIEDEMPDPNHLDHEVVIKELMNLDESLQVPLTLFYLEDYSYREISEILMIPVGTVMSRLHRAKKTLYERLTKNTSAETVSHS
ncbi:MAG: RNA polymerase sigma factor [Verrucomicrobiota bacterium]